MVDNAAAAQLLEDIGSAGLRAVLDMFERDTHRLTGVLHGAARAADAAAFRGAAHGLAGAAGAVGATELERSARLAMTRADLRGSDLLAAAREMERLSAAARESLARFVATLPPDDD